MTYSVKVVATKEYVHIDAPTFKSAQGVALAHSLNNKQDVLVINNDDDNVLCVATYSDSPEPHSHLSLSTIGAIDDPST